MSHGFKVNVKISFHLHPLQSTAFQSPILAKLTSAGRLHVVPQSDNKYGKYLQKLIYFPKSQISPT